MTAVILVYSGFIVLLIGILCLLKPLARLRIRTRRRAGLVVGLGLILTLVGMALPAPLREVTVEQTLLDRFMPVYQFSEFHSRRIEAPPERVFRAVQEVSAGEISLFQTLTWIRSPRWPGGGASESILNPSPTRPMLDVALGSGFELLAEEEGREVVVGTLVIGGRMSSLEAGEFGPLKRPGFAKAALNFRVEPQGPGASLLTTETRIFATDPSSRRRFGAYWRVIYPGSALIRVMWLRAIEKRAEA